MARLTDDDFAAFREESARSAAAPLGPARLRSGELRNDVTDAWLEAGDRLAEKAIAALDLGEDERAAALVRRIVALPLVDEDSTRSGLMAVGVLLVGEIVDPLEDDPEVGLLDLPLRLLPTLDAEVGTELRRALGALLDYDLPAALARRIRDVTDDAERLQQPFAGVPDAALPAVVTGVLRVVLRLRTGA